MKQVLDKGTMIHDKSQLTEIFRSGCKSKEDFRVGFEFEALAVNSYNYKAVPYSGKNGIRDFLTHYKALDRMDEVYTDKSLLGLKGESGFISLEPGSQTELSTFPYKKISDIASKIEEYNRNAAILGEEFGIIRLGYGIQPVSTFDNIEMIPKRRYDIMADYLPGKGDKALVMMKETAGLQTSLDYESEEDAMNKLKVALAISPIITAMFANSPIRDGKETGYKSYRASAWLNTDNDRCGLISKKIFEGDFSFDDYAQYLLDVPMFFIERDNVVIKATHLTFRQFMADGLAGFQADVKDWDLHMTTVFPEVRLKNYIEIRNCDCQRADMILALPALVKGIMYNKTALNQAWGLVKELSFEEIDELRHSVPKFGLETILRGIKIFDLAKELVNIAEASLLSNPETADEAGYLEKLKELVGQEKTPADIILKNWNHDGSRNIKNLVEYSKLS